MVVGGLLPLEPASRRKSYTFLPKMGRVRRGSACGACGRRKAPSKEVWETSDPGRRVDSDQFPAFSMPAAGSIGAVPVRFVMLLPQSASAPSSSAAWMRP